ncbi:unnamed protein product (macronuclear) [Paramecium tetraurelia]|uniref:Generative cell specific-1/HAP2 domain-containing protein n=1 Tax=Paramecium tetraurelia TaxID=5888 RepID=A0BZ59_PARTE|nr:uncharacterized protein GSPATT00033679001 [Paramecium tetraurelia]CAK63826.1 unnamed protein product [Paramecium tetraurelia]|eukprot:XP_001431224.1 hypothetical protein (macronuclear) [Paramecium tetraurelia strain d4-2]
MAEIISQSQINKCYSNSTNNTECSEKMLISLTVENAQNTVTEYIKISETTIDNQTSQLKTPIIISITKTPVYAFYPLKYTEDYNSQPYEVKIAGAILSCDDSWYSNSPTCGFQYEKKEKIFDSQGFCCSCGILDLIGLSDEFARGNICHKAGLTTATMAFCLRYSTLWYSAYEISTYSIYYNITISITYSNQEQEELQLGSEVKVVQGKTLIGRIIGDFTPLNPPPSLESFYFMRPSSPNSHARVQAGSAAFMIVSKDQVGRGECNKIGVSYSAFRTEAERCKKQVKSCLKNQLEDFYIEDQALIANNSQPKYLLSRYGKFKSIYLNNETYLQYSVEGSMQTMITLEITTTGLISYVVNLGKGKIDLAEIQDFEAKSGNGLLYAQITNVGDIESEFNTYLNCSINVIPINSAALYLKPLESYIVKKDVNVLSDMNKSNICTFSLLNNKGTLLDQKQIEFNTTEIQHESEQNHEEQNIKDNEVLASDESQDNCYSDCSVFLDITCYIFNDCNSQIITFFTVLGITFIFLIICLTCLSYRKKLCCCKKSHKCKPSVLETIVQKDYKTNKKQQKRYDNSIYENNIDLLENSSLQLIENRIMYLNLASGSDPISNYLQSDVSFEVLTSYQRKQLINMKIKRNSDFLKVFQNVYGLESLERNVKKYFQKKCESVLLFNNLLTDLPLFSLL